MKKRFLLVLIIGLASSSFSPKEIEGKQTQLSFEPGEVLSYKFHYGFVNAGVADIEVLPKLYRVNDRVCYKMNITGKTTGSFDFFLKIRNQYGSYVDTSSMKPQKAYRIIQEGKYKLTEVTTFNHADGKVNVNKNGKEDKEYQVPTNVQDLVSSYYYLRTVDFTTVKVGDIIVLKSFLDDKTYDFSLRYLGKEKIKTDLGKVNAIILSPIMPENGLFNGKNSIKAWFSDDLNRIPLKAKAELYVGSVEMDITASKGLRNPLNMAK